MVGDGTRSASIMPGSRSLATTSAGRRERAVDRAHLHGIVPCRTRRILPGDRTSCRMLRAACLAAVIELLRPLAEYEQVAGGGW